jgi:tetratricopeptide (TPR) repeat protein
VALLGLVWVGCRDRPLQVPSGTPVVLISIDTLRADRLPAYGYDGVETSAIDSLRQDSILFERAYSHTPLTLPAHASLLTGLLPAGHGLRDNAGNSLDASRIDAGEIPYLPAAFKSLGYATGAAVSSFVLRGKIGLEKGFDLYEDGIEFRTGSDIGGRQRPGTETLSLITEWLRGVAGQAFFLFFHLNEPHTPYQPPEPFRSRYASPYDGEIAAADQVVGSLLAELKSLGVYDRAVILLLSDHGEGLGEHGEPEHGLLLYTETLQVPLMLKLPGARWAGQSVSAPVQLIDVYPTLAGLLGLPGSEHLRGRSLVELTMGEAPARRLYSETFYPRIHLGWSELTALTDDRYHYIEGPDPELYDLETDPSQRHNILRERRKVVAEMRQELRTYDRALAAPEVVDPETLEALAALGYLGSAAVESEGPLADPKSRLDTLVDLRAGHSHQSRGEYRQAADSFRRVLEVNPLMLDAWKNLGHSLHSLGELDEALEAYRKALQLSKGAPSVALSLGALYLDQRQLEEAESHTRLALEGYPSQAHGLLAQIALERGDLEVAERQARLALDEKTPSLDANLTLADILNIRGEGEEALELVRQTEEIFEAQREQSLELIQGLYLLKGKILGSLGRLTEAEEAFRQEIELFPQELTTYSKLAMLHALTGRASEAQLVLRRMVEVNPLPEAYAEAVRTLQMLNDRAGADFLLRIARDKFPEDEDLERLARADRSG